jgi:hypothetical protein
MRVKNAFTLAVLSMGSIRLTLYDLLAFKACQTWQLSFKKGDAGFVRYPDGKPWKR